MQESSAAFEQAVQTNLNSQRIHFVVFFLYCPTCFWLKAKSTGHRNRFCAISHPKYTVFSLSSKGLCVLCFYFHFTIELKCLIRGNHVSAGNQKWVNRLEGESIVLPSNVCCSNITQINSKSERLVCCCASGINLLKMTNGDR